MDINVTHDVRQAMGRVEECIDAEGEACTWP